MADTPDVPDLKKAQEDKAALFAWKPDSTIAKSSATASIRAGAPSGLERLKGLSRGKIAAIAGVLLICGLVFSFAALRLGGTADGGGSNLGGIASTMKIRFASQTDPRGNVVRVKTVAASEKMRFDLIKGAPTDVTEGDEAVGGQAETVERVGGGGEGLKHNIGALSQSAGSGGAGGAGAGAPDKDGAHGGQDSAAAGGGLKSGASFGSMKLRGMQGVSPTAGFRGLQGRRGAPSRTINRRGSGAAPFGSGGSGDASSGTSASVGGGAGAAGGGMAPGSGGFGAGSGGAAAAGGGGGGGGGAQGGGTAGDADTAGLDSIPEIAAKIAQLEADALIDFGKSEDARNKAIALQAAGLTPGAIYEMTQYKKYKDAGEAKKAEAARLTAEMSAAADAMPVTPATGP